MFSMLENLLGPDAFSRGIKEFYRQRVQTQASWSDSKRPSKASGGHSGGSSTSGSLDQVLFTTDKGTEWKMVRVSKGTERVSVEVRGKPPLSR
jgi:hypothetical protein